MKQILIDGNPDMAMSDHVDLKVHVMSHITLDSLKWVHYRSDCLEEEAF